MSYGPRISRCTALASALLGASVLLAAPASAGVFDDIGQFFEDLTGGGEDFDGEAASKFCDAFAMDVAGPPGNYHGDLSAAEKKKRDASFQGTVQRLGCNFNDSPRWTDGFWERYNWCFQELRVNHEDGKQTVWKEKSYQKDMVRICEKADICNKYANDAVKMAQEYKAAFCFEDPRFAGRYSLKRFDHFNWCMKVASPNGRESEKYGRYADMRQCNSRRGIVRTLGKKKLQKTAFSGLTADPQSEDPGQSEADMLPQGNRAEFEDFVTPVIVPEPSRVRVDAGAAERAKEVIKDGAKAVVDRAAALGVKQKILEYGEAHKVDVGRAAHVAKEKLKERLSDLKVRRTTDTKLGGGLRSKLSRLKGLAKVGLLRRLRRH